MMMNESKGFVSTDKWQICRLPSIIPRDCKEYISISFHSSLELLGVCLIPQGETTLWYFRSYSVLHSSIPEFHCVYGKAHLVEDLLCVIIHLNIIIQTANFALRCEFCLEILKYQRSIEVPLRPPSKSQFSSKNAKLR